MNSHCVMDTEKLPNDMQVTQIGSVRFVQILQFLSEEDRNVLIDDVLVHKDAFHPPGIPGHYSKDLTSTWLTRKLGKSPADPCLIDQVCARLSKRIVAQLPALCEALGIEPFTIKKPSINILSGQNGHYGLPHKDTYSEDMKITVLYYFHNSHKAFQGGDLELFESDSSSISGHKEQPLATIEHQDNLLLAFACDTYHGVTEVQGGAESFERSRFAAISFIRS